MKALVEVLLALVMVVLAFFGLGFVVAHLVNFVFLTHITNFQGAAALFLLAVISSFFRR